MKWLFTILGVIWLGVFPAGLFWLWFNEIGRAAEWRWEACLIPWGLTLLFAMIFGAPGASDGGDSD